MARTKKLTTAQKIEKIKAEIESLEIQIDAKTSELKDLELELRNEQAAELADAIAKSGKSLDEVMDFLIQYSQITPPEMVGVIFFLKGGISCQMKFRKNR